MGRKGGDRLRKACCGRVYLRGGTYEPQACEAALVAYQSGQRGRQASLCRHVKLVEEKQLVIHLLTRCQKTDMGPIIDGGGCQTADP